MTRRRWLRALRGTGAVQVSPLLYVSTRQFSPAPWVRLQGYLNGGIDLDAEDVDASDPRWGVGLDWGLGPDVTAATAFLGRHALSREERPRRRAAGRSERRTRSPSIPRTAASKTVAAGSTARSWLRAPIGGAS